MDPVIRRPGFNGGLVGAASRDDFRGIHPFTILQIGAIVQLPPVPDGTLGHPTATLLGIILCAMDKGALAPLPKGLGEIDIELGCDKCMNLLIESHSDIPLF